LKFPNHLAIIMDGNGRWAKSQGRERVYGHIKGARVARNIIEACAQRKVPYLTLFTFSSENWFRPAEEVSFLMSLLVRHLRKQRRFLVANNIRFQVIGDRDVLPQTVREEVDRTIEYTAKNSGMVLTFALSYGSRNEIVQAAKKIAERVQTGILKMEHIDEDVFSTFLSTDGCPDPDLIIRTSGETRLSNFLLWQAAYAELYFTDVMWPHFSVRDLDDALTYFASRERRFGRVDRNLEIQL
jgi:undecaprenyl diphosphate synthase